MTSKPKPSSSSLIHRVTAPKTGLQQSFKDPLKKEPLAIPPARRSPPRRAVGSNTARTGNATSAFAQRRGPTLSRVRGGRRCPSSFFPLGVKMLKERKRRRRRTEPTCPLLPPHTPPDRAAAISTPPPSCLRPNPPTIAGGPEGEDRPQPAPRPQAQATEERPPPPWRRQAPPVRRGHCGTAGHGSARGWGRRVGSSYGAELVSPTHVPASLLSVASGKGRPCHGSLSSRAQTVSRQRSSPSVPLTHALSPLLFSRRRYPQPERKKLGIVNFSDPERKSRWRSSVVFFCWRWGVDEPSPAFPPRERFLPQLVLTKNIHVHQTV